MSTDCSSPLQILLIEDHPDTAKVMKLILERAGIVVHVAASAADARSAVQSGAFDLAICDKQLPDVNGTNLCRELLASRNLKSICLSGSAQDDGGGDDVFAAYLTKPIDVAKLLAAIERVTGRSVSRPPA